MGEGGDENEMIIMNENLLMNKNNNDLWAKHCIYNLYIC